MEERSQVFLVGTLSSSYMAEPLSIFSITITAITICSNLLRYVRCIRTADMNFEPLQRQLQRLHDVLDNLRDQFEQPIIQQTIRAVQRDFRRAHEARYWETVKMSITDCGQTLQRLQGLLNCAQGGGVFMRLIRGVRLEDYRDKIERLLQEVIFFRETMQFACQWLLL